jgi:hypothetical protein
MKKIVYILSTNYSGSHLLSLLIGSHSRYQHIGEVKGLGKNINPTRQYCGICDGHENCPVLMGVTADNIDRVYDIVFSNIDSGIYGLVDTSKKTTWARRFLADKHYEKKFIFLIRDPRSLVRRWLVDEKIDLFRERLKLIKYPPRYMNMALTGDAADVYVGKWLQQNWKILNFIRKNSLDCFTLTYHDLVVKEFEILTNLMAWLGDKYEPGQEEYWNFTHHGSAKYQYKDTKTINLDCRWKEYLSVEQQEKIFNHKGIKYFLNECGLLMGADGLTPI